MPRPEKVQAVEEIRDRLGSARATYLAEYRGLSVNQQQKLRRALRAAGGEFKVVKMSLARRAADELGIEFGDDLTGPTGLAFADTDAVSIAKVLRDFAKENDALVIKSGVLGTEMLTPESVSKLADIEPREVLLAKIAGAAKAPLVNFAGMLQSFTRDAASLFSQLLEKKETDPASQDSPASQDAVESTEATASQEATDTDGEAPAQVEAAADEEVVSEPAAEADEEVVTEPETEAPVAAAAEEE